MPAKLAVCDCLRDVVEPHERRYRDLDPLRDVLPSDLGLTARSLLTDFGRERYPNSRLAIAIAQPANLELADRDEAIHAQGAPHEVGLVAAKLERAERQSERAIGQVDLHGLGFCGGAAGDRQTSLPGGR